MRIPVISGRINRRLLLNYRADPGCVQRLLPRPFRPKLHEGYAIVGVCLIRLEQLRPPGVPKVMGFTSENAAHRMAVEWTDPAGHSHEGVFVLRRDTNSRVNLLAGGRFFPGEQNLANFSVADSGGHVEFSMEPMGRGVTVCVVADETDSLPASSCFKSLAEASAFFKRGSVGYSFTQDQGRLEGIELRTLDWRLRPLAVKEVYSSFYADRRFFLEDFIAFDHGLIMRDVSHEWRKVKDLEVSVVQP